MIRPADAAKLAFTKLRSRKVRLLVTVVVSGLLFSGVVFTLAVARGVFHSLSEFGKEGLGQRYIVSGQPSVNTDIYTNQAIMDRAVVIYNDTVTKKKAEAKRLGVPYESTLDPSPIEEYSTPNGKTKILITAHPAAVLAINEWAAANLPPGMDDFKKSAAPFNATAFYRQKRIQMPMDGSELQVLKDGKESFAQPNAGKDRFISSPLETFTYELAALDTPLLQPFVLPDQTLEQAADGSIPIVANYGAIETILKLPPLPVTATPSEKLARVQEVRQKAPSVRVQVCYRNEAASSLISQALSAQQEAELNKNNKDYQKPELIYGLPAESCGAAPVVRDVRSAETKKAASKKEEFDQKFGKQAPTQILVTFRVVGITPDQYYGSASTLTQIIGSLVNTSLGGGWFIPMEATERDALMAKLFDESNYALGGGTTYFGEFTSASSLRDYITAESCDLDFTQMDPYASCKAAGKLFIVVPFGNNSLGLESTQQTFYGLFIIVMGVVALIACIIMSGTVGKMVADSRRETAVFRAMGAKRLDIAQIYLFYAVFLSLFIAAFAVATGLLGAWLVDRQFSVEATLKAVVAFSSQDTSRTFHLFAINPTDLLMVLGLVVAAGLLSSVIPLLRNIRRNPIGDMRDE